MKIKAKMLFPCLLAVCATALVICGHPEFGDGLFMCAIIGWMLT